jgi:hypothetical protein
MAKVATALTFAPIRGEEGDGACSIRANPHDHRPGEAPHGPRGRLPAPLAGRGLGPSEVDGRSVTGGGRRHDGSAGGR